MYLSKNGINSFINDRLRSKQLLSNNHEQLSRNKNVNKLFFKISYVKSLSKRLGNVLRTDIITIAFKNENMILKVT